MYLSHKISVNFSFNLHRFYCDFVNIFCHRKEENVVKFTDFLWSYKISVNVQIYRDCNLQRKCGHLTEILQTFLKSINGSSFPVVGFLECSAL